MSPYHSSARVRRSNADPELDEQIEDHDLARQRQLQRDETQFQREDGFYFDHESQMENRVLDHDEQLTRRGWNMEADKAAHDVKVDDVRFTAELDQEQRRTRAEADNRSYDNRVDIDDESYAQRKASENRAYDQTTQADADFYRAEKESDIYERQQKFEREGRQADATFDEQVRCHGARHDHARACP